MVYRKEGVYVLNYVMENQNKSNKYKIKQVSGQRHNINNYINTVLFNFVKGT